MFRRARLVLAAWFTLALAVTLVAVGGVAYVLIRNDIDREINDSLAATEQALMQPVTRPDGPGGTRGTSRDGDDLYRLPPGIPSDVFIVYTDSKGTVLSNPRAIDVDDVNFAQLCAESGTASRTTDVTTSAGHLRIISQPGNLPNLYIHIGR